jgi:hypothetical protein
MTEQEQREWLKSCGWKRTTSSEEFWIYQEETSPVYTLPSAMVIQQQRRIEELEKQVGVSPDIVARLLRQKGNSDEAYEITAKELEKTSIERDLLRSQLEEAKLRENDKSRQILQLELKRDMEQAKPASEWPKWSCGICTNFSDRRDIYVWGDRETIRRTICETPTLAAIISDILTLLCPDREMKEEKE